MKEVTLHEWAPCLNKLFRFPKPGSIALSMAVADVNVARGQPFTLTTDVRNHSNYASDNDPCCGNQTGRIRKMKVGR